VLRSLIGLSVLAAGIASAQGFVHKYSVFGQGGVARIFDDEGSLGSGYYFGGGLGYRFHRRLGAEFDVFRFRHERDVAGGRLQFAGTGTYVTGNVLFYLSQAAVQPYLLGGIGGFRYTNRSNPQTTPETSSTRLAGSAGFGLQAFVTSRVALRPEVRLMIGGARMAGGVEPPISALRFSMGVGYHW
jgi:hypothetical protein